MNIVLDKSRLCLGVIGGGINSAIGRTHMIAAQMDHRWQVVCGAFSSCDETCRESAKLWGLASEQVYSCWRTMLDEWADQLDAVVVLTPTPDHYEVIAELLARKIPVISEKALVASVKEAEILQQQFDPHQHFLAVTYNYSGYPMVRELKHLIASGALGKIMQVQLEMPQEGFLRATRPDGIQPWRRQDGSIPTLCLDLGVHLHHLAVFLTGLRPVAASAHMSKQSPLGVIDQAQILVRYDNGASGHMWMTKTALGHRNGLKVHLYGEKGAATWLQMAPEQLQLAWQDGRIEILDRGGPVHIANAPRYTRMKPGHPAGFVEAFANLYWDLADALVQWKTTGTFDNPYVFGLPHATEGLKLFERAYQAFLQQKWMEI